METYRELIQENIDYDLLLQDHPRDAETLEAKSRGLPLNRANPRGRDYIAGTFLLCGFEGEHFISLTPAQQTEFQTHFAEPGEFTLFGPDAICANRGEAAMAVIKLWDSMKTGESVTLTKWGETPYA